MNFPSTGVVGRFVAGVLPALLLIACDGGLGAGSDSGSVSWTGRHLVASDLAWSVREGVDGEDLQALADEYDDKGYLLASIDPISDGMAVQYTTLWHENRDNRNWAFAYDLSVEQLATAMAERFNAGLRPLDIEAYEANGELRYAAVWIENREGLQWSAGVEMSTQEYEDFVEEREAQGLRPVDIELYEIESEPAFATIWYDNTRNLSTVQLLMLDRTEYLAALEQFEGDGYRLFDMETRETADGRRYAALLENPADNYAWRRSEDEPGSDAYANLSREYADLGYRPIDLEHFEDAGEARIASAWLETDFRYRYPRQDQVHDAVEAFSTGHEIPGLSVAIIERGRVIYRRGVGYADVENERIAHGRTVYNAASVSKVFGATLAARLESTGALRDGTPVALNLADLTSTWLTEFEVPDAGGTETVSLPGHHTHTLEQLAAHLGCVGHYNEIPNQTEHYEWGSHAAPSIWDAPLLDDCNVGDQREYSTHGFTLLQAAMEQSVGQRFSDLLVEELSEPWGLDSLRAQFAEETLPENYDRAVPYDDEGDPSTYQNSSWKVMGGGIEVDAMDMARFGWLTLRGRIVSPSVRDNRLWASVAPGCAAPWDEERCRNGIGWRLGSHMGEMTPVHGGSWRGARSELRVYPEQQLVIAVMTNYRGPEGDRVPVADLVRDLAEIILE